MGPGAASMTLIIVMLSVSVLGMLALMSSRSDLQLEERSIQVVQGTYRMYEQAEISLAELDEIAAVCAEGALSDEDYMTAVGESLPEGYRLEERQIRWEISDGQRTLELAAEVLPLGSDSRLRRVRHVMSADMEGSWDWD